MAKHFLLVIFLKPSSDITFWYPVPIHSIANSFTMGNESKRHIVFGVIKKVCLMTNLRSFKQQIKGSKIPGNNFIGGGHRDHFG